MNVAFDFGSNHYLLKIQNGDLQIDKTKIDAADLAITTDEQTYIDVETGKLNPQQAFMTGKIQVSDLGKMMQFGTLFKKFQS